MVKQLIKRWGKIFFIHWAEEGGLLRPGFNIWWSERSNTIFRLVLYCFGGRRIYLRIRYRGKPRILFQIHLFPEIY